jgi:hypothetical protein
MFTTFEYTLSGQINIGLDDANLRLIAGKCFNRAYARGRRGQMWARILGRQNHLEPLSSQPLSSHGSTSRIVPVSIRQIKGSVGRSEDFDVNFNPLQEHSRSRWVSIATAIQQGIPLPPVELVQVGEVYYVRDGHHRISVARSLEQEAIEARIVN